MRSFGDLNMDLVDLDARIKAHTREGYRKDTATRLADEARGRLRAARQMRDTDRQYANQCLVDAHRFMTRAHAYLNRGED